MKKLSFLLVAAVLLSAMPLRADEGMWLLPLLEKFNIKKMQELGLKLSAQDIYDINNSSLKDAIVHFGGGCTGEVISDKGLLITNYHCGYGNIQRLSSVEHDYLNDGYWAMKLSEELPAEGLTVTFIDSFTDVTADVEEINAKAKTDADRQKAMEKLQKKLLDQATKRDPYLTGRITSFYNNNVYYFVTSKTFRDIRFVGAPPTSIGKFGADTDNWTWPRHKADFSMFRIYADKNNNPAAYSPDNVPYTPKKSLAISMKGIKENDFTMIIGFPGRTTRFMTSEEAKETQNINNTISIYTRGVKQDIWMNDMLADQKVRIQYSSKHAGSANGWKKYIGMNETFGKLDIIERRAAEETEFNNWVKQDPARVAKYGKALEKINSTVKERAEAAYVVRYLNETLRSIELISATNPRRASRMDAFFKDYSVSTDIKLAKAMIKIYKEKVDAKYLPSFYATIDKDFSGNIDAFVDNLYNKSVYTSKEKYDKAVADKVDLTQDPATVIYNSIDEVSRVQSAEMNKNIATYQEGKKEYLAGVLEMNGNKAIYPDANSTMRLTYGQVLPYSPRDAVRYDYVTTVEGVMEKEDPNNWEFIVPAKLKELWKAKDYGEYAMENGRMPVAFISTCDITGGNSGSPILNANGELIGLAFDGNWEAMSSDVIFEPELQRCINVDIRYCLFIIDKFGGAGYLLDEMKLVR